MAMKVRYKLPPTNSAP